MNRSTKELVDKMQGRTTMSDKRPYYVWERKKQGPSSSIRYYSFSQDHAAKDWMRARLMDEDAGLSAQLRIIDDNGHVWDIDVTCNIDTKVVAK